MVIPFNPSGVTQYTGSSIYAEPKDDEEARVGGGVCIRMRPPKNFLVLLGGSLYDIER